MNRTGIEGYREFLARRDGEADLLNRRLANRELFFHQLEANPVRSARPADRATFLRNLRRRKPEDGLDKKMLFLLATAKLNQAERFGVGLGETYGRNSDENLPPENVYLELEEHYHTRLLAYAQGLGLERRLRRAKRGVPALVRSSSMAGGGSGPLSLTHGRGYLHAGNRHPRRLRGWQGGQRGVLRARFSPLRLLPQFDLGLFGRGPEYR